MQEVIGSTPIFSTKPDHNGQVFLFMPFSVYILYSEKRDKYYIGQTEDLENRLLIHNAGRNTSTKAGIPWTLKYTETFQTRSEATIRETEIKKKKSRKYIEWLISTAG
jgi:putative endonuclease